MLSGSAWLARPTSTNLHAVGRLPAAACRGQVQRPGDRLDAHRASLFCPTAPWRAAWPFCLSFCLIHPRPGPFTSVRSGRVCAVRGRWRTSVNADQHCWKACWGQPLRSSNLLSSATLTCDDALGSCSRAALYRQRVSHFLSQFESWPYALSRTNRCEWHAEMTHVVPGQGRRGRT